MNAKERELEELVNQVEADNVFSMPPLFELYATLFSILIAIIFFIYPTMLVESEGAYSIMLAIMPQTGWALSFFTACMLKAIGLIIDNNAMRIIGLLVSSVLYVALSVCYGFFFPSIGGTAFACMAIFTILSIPIVKYTTIRHKKEDGK